MAPWQAPKTNFSRVKKSLFYRNIQHQITANRYKQSRYIEQSPKTSTLSRLQCITILPIPKNSP